MGFGIIEDRPTPPQVYNWRIYVFAIVASFGALTFGYDGAFFGTTLARSSFQEYFGFNDMTKSQRTSETSNITSSYLAAGFFGSIFSWPLGEMLGRVRSIQVTSVIFVVGVVLMTATTSSLPMMYGGRVLTGLGVGALTGIIPSYIAEVAPPAIRGQLTGYFDVAYHVGSVVGFWINYGINQNMDPTLPITFRIPIAIQFVPGGLLAIGTLFLTESPALLLRKGKKDLAIKNLCYLRQLPEDHQYMLEEVGMIEARLAEQAEVARGSNNWLGMLRGAFTELKVDSIRYRLYIVSVIFLLQNWSGSLGINYYSPTLFRSIGVTDVALYTGIYGITRSTAAIVFYAFLVDRTGRRKPWLASATVCCLSLLFLALFTTLGDVSANAPASSVAASKAAIAFVMIYGVAWSFGGNGLPWIVAAEIFPTRIRPITGAYAASLQWLHSCVVTLVFPYMVASPMGVKGVFFFFSAMCGLTAIFTFAWVPETKGVPIECCEALFSGPMKHRAWRATKLFPPTGIPPLPDHLVAGQTAYIESHGRQHEDSKMEREEIETV